MYENPYNSGIKVIIQIHNDTFFSTEKISFPRLLFLGKNATIKDLNLQLYEKFRIFMHQNALHNKYNKSKIHEIVKNVIEAGSIS